MAKLNSVGVGVNLTKLFFFLNQRFFHIFATQSFQNVSIFKMKFKYGCSLETIDVTNGDINSLNPQQWLTDNFIYCYMSTFNKVHPNLFV